MANDVNRFDAGIVYMHFLWIGPITTVAVTYFVWLEVGVAALVGIAALLVFVPVQSEYTVSSRSSYCSG